MADTDTDKPLDREPADGREAADAGAAPPAASAAPDKAKSSFPPSGRASARIASAKGGPLAAYEAIARSARLPDLVAVTQRVLAEAARVRASAWDFSAKVTSAADDAKLTRDDADTAFGNVLDVLGKGAEGEAERALASGLWAHAIAEARRDDEDRLAGDILWLATHSAFDATPLLDRAMGEDADELWRSIGERVARIDEGRSPALGRGEALVGCAALAASESIAARKVAAELAPRVKDATLKRLLGAAGDAPLRQVHLEGEAMSPPRSVLLTALLAITGILFVMHAVRLFARFALAYRTPSELSLSEDGVRVKTRTEMLGRTLREREHVIVRSGLVRVVREVRYPRLAFYAGLLALAVGSYVGIRALSDGVRSASPSLLLTGLVVIAVGIAADFVLGTVLPGSRGRVRISFVPRAGRVLCVGDVDAHRADEALKQALGSK